MEHPAFNRRSPNRIRSLIGEFAMGNFEGLRRAAGDGNETARGLRDRAGSDQSADRESVGAGYV